VSSVTEITLVGGDILQVEGEAKQVEATIVGAARGSIMELAWLTEAQTGRRLAINPEHVLILSGLGNTDSDGNNR
jgi:hypothetical protein